MGQLEHLPQNKRAWAQAVSERDPGFFERLASQQAHKLSPTSSVLLTARVNDIATRAMIRTSSPENMWGPGI